MQRNQKSLADVIQEMGEWLEQVEAGDKSVPTPADAIIWLLVQNNEVDLELIIRLILAKLAKSGMKEGTEYANMLLGERLSDLALAMSQRSGEISMGRLLMVIKRGEY